MNTIDKAIALVESEGEEYSHRFESCVLNKLYGQFETDKHLNVARLFSNDTNVPYEEARWFYGGCFPQLDKKFLTWEDAEARDGSVGPQVIEVLNYLKEKYGQS